MDVDLSGRIDTALVLSMMYASGCTDSKANANDNVILALMQGQSQNGNDDNARTLDLIDEGKEIFRFDTFGDEGFWGDTLKLHLAMKARNSGRRRRRKPEDRSCRRD